MCVLQDLNEDAHAPLQQTSACWGTTQPCTHAHLSPVAGGAAALHMAYALPLSPLLDFFSCCPLCRGSSPSKSGVLRFMPLALVAAPPPLLQAVVITALGTGVVSAGVTVTSNVLAWFAVDACPFLPARKRWALFRMTDGSTEFGMQHRFAVALYELMPRAQIRALLICKCTHKPASSAFLTASKRLVWTLVGDTRWRIPLKQIPAESRDLAPEYR